MVDMILHGGRIVDGTGAPGYQADLVIDKGKIIAIENASQIRAALEINARGKIVCPGFIDIHNHSDLPLLANRFACAVVADEAPMWSPDSSKIAFVSDYDGNKEIYVVEISTGKVERITYDPLDNVSPQWSPDGKFLAYFTKKSKRVELSMVEFENDSCFRNPTHKVG
jgi:tricorn protease-like protein